LLLPVLAIASLILTAGFSGAALVQVPTDLARLHAEYVAHKRARTAAPFRSANALMPVSNDRVFIDAVAAGDVDALEADLRALGLEQAAVFGRTVSGRLPLAAIDALSHLPSLKLARPALATANVGSVASQGDPAMRSDVARATFGVDGTGITVGVLSDSFDCLGGAAADVASGDLPVVNVLQDEPGCGSGTDEGRGMAQLVYDVAPGTVLAFATAFTGQAGFANNILALQAAGASVIVDDVGYLAEPMFQDGIIAQAVDTVVAAGVPYFSSAGNSARAAYQAGFVNSGIDLGMAGTNQIPGGPMFLAHDFDPGPGVDVFQTVTFPGGQTDISLQWADPFFSVGGAPGAQTDLDIALFDMAGNFLFGSFGANVGGDPVELLSVNGPGQGQIAIGKFAGPDPSLLKYVAFRSTFVVNEFATNSGTIFGHANAVGAEAVGAAPFFDTPAFGVSPPLLEPFSSGGTTPILFTSAGAPTADPRAHKPEITAPDGTNTTFFGTDIGQDADTFPNFFGTSAAAPQAGAVAALMLELSPRLPPASVNSFLEQTAIDIGPPGFDTDSGSGLIQADAALAAVQICGNGVVETPETCDDANTTAGDGCSDSCQIETGFTCPTPGAACEPVCGDHLVVGGEACDEGMAGNGAADTCCSATCTFRTGVCRPATDPCDAAETCSGTDATCPADVGAPATAGCCSVTPREPCRPSLAPERTKLLVRNRPPDTADLMVWKWMRGTATDASALGDPLNQDQYALCLYDGGGVLVAEAVAPPGGTCGTKPCWKGLGKPPGSKGYKYADKDRTPDGLLKVLLKPGADARAKVVVEGRGPNLPDPVLPFALPVTAQVQADNGECWGATYFAAGVRKNDSTQFTAKGGD
jgi:cysteine-rich repeat protein